MFENSCSEKYWNTVLIIDQHILAPRTESQPTDELNKSVVLSDIKVATSSNPLRADREAKERMKF